MIVALVDNGSLEAAAHLNLRRVAAALSAQTNVPVRAVSWKHSDRIAPELLEKTPAWTLAPFVRAMVALGQRDYVFIPFFVSPQGAIGSALLAEVEALQRALGGFEFTFTDGLAARRVIPTIAAARVRELLTAHADSFSMPPPVVVVDHGGPSSQSATLRDELAAEIRTTLGASVDRVVAASMEGSHPPLLADVLQSDTFASTEAIIAPLFLSPGRHAGPKGDIAEIAANSPARCHIADLVGTHPLAIKALAAALQDSLATVHVNPFVHTFA